MGTFRSGDRLSGVNTRPERCDLAPPEDKIGTHTVRFRATDTAGSEILMELAPTIAAASAGERGLGRVRVLREAPP